MLADVMWCDALKSKCNTRTAIRASAIRAVCNCESEMRSTQFCWSVDIKKQDQLHYTIVMLVDVMWVDALKSKCNTCRVQYEQCAIVQCAIARVKNQMQRRHETADGDKVQLCSICYMRYSYNVCYMWICVHNMCYMWIWTFVQYGEFVLYVDLHDCAIIKLCKMCIYTIVPL